MRLNTIRSLLLTSLIGSSYSGPAENCNDQKNCISWSITTANTPAKCSGPCDLKVCATINGAGVNGCVKDGAWSHGFNKKPDTCPAPGFSTGAAITPIAGQTYCQTVGAGTTAQFIFKDGNGCSGLTSGSVSIGSATGTCRSSTTGDSSPSGKGNVGKECVWEIKTSSANCGTPGGGGDPHFRTYDGTVYSYHGECDLIMTRSPSFDHGLGLDIHTRTDMIADSWTLISNAAIRIGEDVFEVTNQGVTYLNGIEHTDFPFEMANKFTVTKSIEFVEEATNEWKESFEAAPEPEERQIFEIDLSGRSDVVTERFSADKIHVSLYRIMISVGVDAHMPDAEGMLGTHDLAGLVGRDHQTVYSNVDEMGAAWQVLPKIDGNLFVDAGTVIYPEKCFLPTLSIEKQTRRLRLGASDELVKRAQAACAKVSPDMHSLCVDDVLRTGDFNIANAFAF